ncbi:YitT family protein [uncultured Fusobacterium sp.]|uniref:YitT family protein n=1 Tax=uncultured Fusobacterium sp. TaxID=159267 RepID=UPI0025E1492D|nr:YitT family protein [uncultured Fusobacterium sp.]MCF2640027.1 YitT family protein [Fusobacterium varium]
MKNFLFIILGNLIFALGIATFVIPNGLIMGGSTGLALSVQHFLGIDIAITVAVINIVTFLAGLFILGKKFAATTLISTFIFPFFLNYFKDIEKLKHITSDTLLSAIFAALLVGAGVGIVLRVGASTGGLDIPAIILNKKRGVPIAIILYAIDVSILLSQMIFSNIEQILYGIIIVLITTMVINKVIVYGKNDFMVTIISEKYLEISENIHSKIDRGTTFIDIQTGYKKNNQQAVMSVISKRELHSLNKLVQEIDPKAFIIINQVNQVKGRGFSLDKHI